MPEPLGLLAVAHRAAPAPVDAAHGQEQEEPKVCVPVVRAGGAGRWPGSGAVAWVPAELLLASKGRCSCPPCVSAYVAERARGVLRLVR